MGQPLVASGLRPKFSLSALLLLILLCVSILILFSCRNLAIFDQKSLLRGTESFQEWPELTSRLSAKLIISFYRLIVPLDPDSLNLHIRILACVLFLVSVYFLLRKLVTDERWVCLGLLLVFSSRYPFIWLSTELFVASAHCFIVLGILSRWHPILMGSLLAFSALLKSEQPFAIGLYLLLYLVLLERKKEKLTLLVSFMFMGGLLVLPGVLQNGWSYFNLGHSLVSKYADVSDTFFVFGQNYSFLKFEQLPGHEQLPPYLPWKNWRSYMEINFPGAKTLFQAILVNPFGYLDFVLLSFSHSVISFFSTMHGMLSLFFLILLWKYRRQSGWNDYDKILLVAFLGFLPIFLFSTTHVRYLARFYPLLLGYILFSLWYIQSRSQGPIDKLFVRAGFVVLICVFLYQSAIFAHSWLDYRSLLHHDDRVAYQILRNQGRKIIFWMPDPD